MTATDTSINDRLAPRRGRAARQAARPLPAGRRQVHAPDSWLLVTIVALAVFGTVMIFSASFTINLPSGGNAYYYLQRQLLWLGVGAPLFAIATRIDYHVYRRYSVAALLMAVGLLVAVMLLPGGGVEAWGAKRWLRLGPLPAFQPSEIAKMALVLFMADWLDRRGPRLRQWIAGVLPFSLILGGLIFLVMLQPDLGSSSLIAMVGIVMFVVAGADLLHIVLFFFSGIGAFLGLALAAPYRRDRLSLFMKSEAELRALSSGWQLIQARMAIGSGGLLGLGLGASRQKYAWLPAAHTDAIFAVIAEELGLIGCAVVLGLFLVLAVRGFRVASDAPDMFGTLLATGIVSWIVLQALINIGGITTTIPFTGVPLPFISYGGTSLIVDLAAVGVLVNISRHTRSSARQDRAGGDLKSQQLTG